jgi:hypothetical protein
VGSATEAGFSAIEQKQIRPFVVVSRRSSHAFRRSPQQSSLLAVPPGSHCPVSRDWTLREHHSCGMRKFTKLRFVRLFCQLVDD